MDTCKALLPSCEISEKKEDAGQDNWKGERDQGQVEAPKAQRRYTDDQSHQNGSDRPKGMLRWAGSPKCKLSSATL